MEVESLIFLMSFVEANRDPEHWNILSDVDKEVYLRIRSALAAPSNRNKRNKRMDDFKEVLDAIDIFINTDEENKWKRSLVCGVCQLTDGIAINPTRLQHLIFKCKSSINGCLKGLGYDIVVSNPSLNQELLRQIPMLRNDLSELRQWTIRTRTSSPATEVWTEITPPVVTEEELKAEPFELNAFAWKPLEPTSPKDFGEFPPLDDFMFDFL
jgi:hypothetical protein